MPRRANLMPLAPFMHPPPTPPRPMPSAGPSASNPSAASPAAVPTRRPHPCGALPTLVGYGLMILFGLDMAQVFAAYRPFRPEEDQALILQVIERIAVPLVAYVLIFWSEPGAANRFELRVRKVVSMASLGLTLLCAGLAVMAVHSGIRLTTQAVSAIERDERERAAGLTRLGNELPDMAPEQVQATYLELVRRGAGQPQKDLKVEEMRQKIATAVPQAREASAAAARQAMAQARRLQILVSAKYCIGGIIAAVLFLFVWETTASARRFAFFSRRGDSTLTAQERVERFMDFLPNLEDYRWYRRLRRRDDY